MRAYLLIHYFFAFLFSLFNGCWIIALPVEQPFRLVVTCLFEEHICILYFVAFTRNIIQYLWELQTLCAFYRQVMSNSDKSAEVRLMTNFWLLKVPKNFWRVRISFFLFLFLLLHGWYVTPFWCMEPLHPYPKLFPFKSGLKSEYFHFFFFTFSFHKESILNSLIS